MRFWNGWRVVGASGWPPEAGGGDEEDAGV